MKSNPSICSTCNHRRLSVFGLLPNQLTQRMEKDKHVFNFKPGQLIFSEGNPAFMVYHVYSGYVKLSKTGRDGEKLVIRLRGPGDIFGHRAVLAGEPYTADAMAIIETTVCAIQKEIFIEAVKESHDFAFRIMAKLSNDLRASEEQTMSITHENVRQRVARLLLFLIEDNEESRRNKLIIPNSLSRGEMAQMIGTTPESFSRSLKHFVDRRIIETTRSEILILNPSLLRSQLKSVNHT